MAAEPSTVGKGLRRSRKRLFFGAAMAAMVPPVPGTPVASNMVRDFKGKKKSNYGELGSDLFLASGSESLDQLTPIFP